jgi:signal transduction histidine kinase/DNA-binding response OmpR family regulator
MLKYKVTFLLLVCLSFFNTKGQQNIDSLEHLLKSAKDTGRINLLNKLSYALVMVDHKRSFGYASEALKLSEKKNYIKGIADAHWTFGDIYSISSEYTKAIEHAKKALEFYSLIKDEANKGFTLNLLGTTYQDLGLYDKALDYYLQAKKLYEKAETEQRMASIFTNISIIYAIQKRFELSREYYRKALKIDLKNKNYTGAAISYANIANTFFDEKQYQKALQFYDSVVPVLKKEQDYYSLGSAYCMFGGLYYQLKNWEKAIELYHLSIESSEKVNDLKEILNNNVNLAQVYYAKGDLEMATKYGEKALYLAKQVKRHFSYSTVYNTMTMISKAKGDYKLAFEYQEKYIKYNDSLKQNELSQKLLSTQTLYETEVKEQQISSLNKENDLKNIRLSRQRLMIGLVAISLILSILLLMFLLNRYRIKRNANKALEIKNNEIEAQKQLIVEINDKLSIQASELKKLDEAKSRFFTNISHEFRTPLTLIIGPLEVLLPQTADEKIKAEYKIMLRQAKRLLTLVNQLLELSKLEKGLMRLSLSNDDFNRFIRTITTSFTSLATEMKISLAFEGPDIELLIWFDKDKVEKIVTNIITNAFKFTSPGGRIEVILRDEEKTEQFVEIVIRDTGAGIDPEHLEHIFDPFYQASSAVNTRFEGTGVGLALVNEFVNLHHATISVQSKLGSGSEFIVQFPVDKTVYNKDEFVTEENEFEMIKTYNNIEPISKSSAKEQTKKISKEQTIILLVEDNEDMRKYISQNLPEEFQIVEAIDGVEGIEKANEITPDLIIADIMMPRMDGLEMVTILKKDERTSHIPVIFLTAKASDQSKFEGLETHADDYLTKPFSIRELTLRIQNFIFNRQKTREKFEKNISVVPSEIASNSVDEQFLSKALQIIENNMSDFEYNAEQFSQDIGMSRSTLHRKLIALTDKPATEFIRTIRLKRAAQLLSKNSASVSEIAYQTGFGNLSYFTKCFKEQFGKTPSEYSQ